MPHRLVFLDRATLKDSITLRRPGFEHDWVEYDRTEPGEVVGRLKGATIAIVNKVKLTGDILAQLPDLRFIAEAATGTDNLDLDACRERGIVVSNIRGYAVETVPEHTFAMMLALRRNLAGYQQDIAAGEWQRANQFCFFTHPINDLAGQTLGLIGTGAIGDAVARIATAFGMTVLKSERKGAKTCRPGYTPFTDVLASSDVISLHCPLTAQTRNLINRDAFAAMKRQPLLINTARGGLVDEAALVEALDSGQIAGAGFDVTTPEPPKPDNPLLSLLDRPNFILTPHVAWASQRAMQRLADQLIDNVEAFVKGEVRNRVA
ncbi:MAG: D-2-hydroxyacid dehydrogenase [Saccharospirillum sp.]